MEKEVTDSLSPSIISDSSGIESTISESSEQISFSLQSGPIRDTICVATNGLTLKTLKQYASNFIDYNYPNHGFNRLKKRLILLKHDYNSTHLFVPISSISDLTEGSLIEIIVPANSLSESVPIRPHFLTVHSYKSPAFCDYCGEMLFGLFRQGLKCEGCGLDFHKRCAYKVPNDCIHVRSVRPSRSVSISESTNLLIPGNQRSRTSSLLSNKPLEDMITGRIRVPHTFLVHSYNRPTVCQCCRKLLAGLFRQGLQCKDCKLNIHRKCQKNIAMDCTGEVSKEWIDFPKDHNLYEKDEEEDTDSDEDRFDGSCLSTSQKDEPRNKLEVLIEAQKDRIQLSRIVQSFKLKKSNGPKVLREGWISYYTNKDNVWLRQYWRLHTNCIKMFAREPTPEESTPFIGEIPLIDIIQIDWNPSQTHSYDIPLYCFRIKTINIIYYIGEDMLIARSWKIAIRQALMPITPIVSKKYSSQKSPNHSYDLTDVSTQYEIMADEVLGSGQFGTVYSGVHIQSGRVVALKVIDKSKFPAALTSKIPQLKNEVTILQNIQHPGVINMEKMFEDSERIVMVMEKMSSDMLEMIINNRDPLGRLTERVTKFLICQILHALRYLHTRNICHRDLKPENVLLVTQSDFPQIKLCDFDFSRIIGERSFRQSFVGTPAYMAPEVLQKRSYNRSLDLWSIGVITYVSLSGTFPFGDKEDIADQIMNATFLYPPDPWESISSDAVGLISNLLEVNPRMRYTVEQSLLHPWLQDYQLWCDSRELETRVGIRWLTHEADDDRWEEFRIAHNLPAPITQLLTTTHVDWDEKFEDSD